MAENTNKEGTDNAVKLNETNLFAALSYISILSLVFYILKKDDEFIRFHSRQGVVLFVLSLFSIIPIIGWLLAIVVLVLIIVGALKAYSGEKFRLPVVADLAEKFVTF